MSIVNRLIKLKIMIYKLINKKIRFIFKNTKAKYYNKIFKFDIKLYVCELVSKRRM